MEEKTNIFALTKQDTAVLKGIAIIAMLMHHLWGCPPDWVDPYTGVLGFFGNVGKVCVAIFLFCSGYGLSVGYSKVVDGLQCTMHDCKKGFIDTLKFLAKRFVKFYAGYWPIFLIFVPISSFVFGRTLDIAYGEGLNHIKRFVLDIFALNGSRPYNITWWFNYLIILLYLCFPVLYWGVKKGGWLFVLISFLCMRFYCRLDAINHYDILFWQFPFVLGMVWHKKEGCLGGIRMDCRWMRLCLSGISFSLVILIALYRAELLPLVPYIKSGFYVDAFLCLAMVLTVVFFRPYLKWLNKRLAFVGKHSMNTYMTHTFFFGYWFPVLFYSRELGGGMNVVALLAICILLSILIEWLKNIVRWNKLSNIVTEQIDKL